MLDNDVLSPHEIYFRLVQYDLDWHFLTELYFYVLLQPVPVPAQNQTVHLTLTNFNEV